jgi:aminoglycoside phosphotransferase family enzyme/adenylate kinase family enzyme
LVAAMMQAAFYADPCAEVELKQTHISYVFLAGDYVYKLKKPVRFRFIDCSRLDQRCHFCLEEVRLNSRLSPEVYLGVFAIIRRDGGFALGPKVQGEHPEAVEYVVAMRRLPENRMLDRLVAAGAVDRAKIRALAAKIAAFHAAASTERSWNYGNAPELWRAVTADIAESVGFLGDTLEKEQLAEIDAFCQAFIGSHWKHLNRRAHDGRVREGHGDLRAEHVCMRDDTIDIIDCVEFNARLRYGDVASELAFLAMDLERLGAPLLADELVDSYMAESSDADLVQFIPFYKCYRAYVRGKVESLRSRESEVSAVQREHARTLARGYFNLACRYARLGSPALVVVCGLVGTGKSTLVRLLQKRLGFKAISSDEVRKRLAGVSPNQRMISAYGAGIYSSSFSKVTYQTMIDDAERVLREGAGVIVDATFKRAADRSDIMSLAERLNVPVLFIECVAPKEEIMQRLDRRSESLNETSDATFEVYQAQSREFEPLIEIPSSNHLVVDSTRDPAKVGREIESSLQRLTRFRASPRAR